VEDAVSKVGARHWATDLFTVKLPMLVFLDEQFWYQMIHLFT
jgi:hypothetical protein